VTHSSVGSFFRCSLSKLMRPYSRPSFPNRCSRAFPPLDQRARDSFDPVGVTPFCRPPGMDAGFRGDDDEEILDGFRHKPALPGLDGLADDRRQVELFLGEPFQGGLGLISRNRAGRSRRRSGSVIACSLVRRA